MPIWQKLWIPAVSLKAWNPAISFSNWGDGISIHFTQWRTGNKVKKSGQRSQSRRESQDLNQIGAFETKSTALPISKVYPHPVARQKVKKRVTKVFGFSMEKTQTNILANSNIYPVFTGVWLLAMITHQVNCNWVLMGERGMMLQSTYDKDPDLQIVSLAER